MKTALNFLLLIMFISFVGCEKAETILSNNTKDSELAKVNSIDNFAIALAKVLSESKECRELIKTEALKKINHDYDVLYTLVKDIELSDGNTLESYLLKYLNTEELANIIYEKPTLTIFVPTLPENTFSAEIWNIESDIPQVAVRNLNPNTFVYDSAGNSILIRNNEIPAFPVVVIKDNERITPVATRNSSLRSTSGNFNFDFIDPIFNNLENKGVEIETRARASYKHIQKALDSYNIFENSQEGWQRDYIYYNLTKDINKGPYDSSLREGIVGFELVGDGRTAYNKISDSPDDPILDGKYHRVSITPTRGYLTPWTDGEFEFQVKCYFGNKNAGITEYTTRFRCDPNRLFKMNLKDKSGDKYEIIGFENLFIRPNLPLFDWNIENYSSTIKLKIEEFDLSEVIKRATSSTTEFATNFGFDASYGTNVKIGLKFGASAKSTHTVSYEETISVGSDDLGEVIINFGDIVVKDNTYITKRTQTNTGSGGSISFPNLNSSYTTGYYRVYIAPMEN